MSGASDDNWSDKHRLGKLMRWKYTAASLVFGRLEKWDRVCPTVADTDRLAMLKRSHELALVNARADFSRRSDV